MLRGGRGAVRARLALLPLPPLPTATLKKKHAHRPARGLRAALHVHACMMLSFSTATAYTDRSRDFSALIERKVQETVSIGPC